MAALKFAVSALNREKPHSSVTDWVEILTSREYGDEAYDGLPELVASIGLQSTGPTEASRAIRKKIKHGDNHQKYRALVILKALMDNGDRKFQTTCMDDQLIDAIRQLASDPITDQKVKKKLLSVLTLWKEQFKNEPSLSTVAGLYRQCRPPDRRSHGHTSSADLDRLYSAGLSPVSEKEAAKKRAKQEKEEAKEKARKAEEEEAQRKKSRPRRAPFNFETEKPQILTSIANASQASSNLVNAIMLVNGDKESIMTNERVQECLQNAKVARKPIVRYIQLVENEEVIGTLIETNERIISALQMYDNLSAPDHPTDPTAEIQAGMDAVTITPGELSKLQHRQRAAVERARQQRSPASEDGGHDYGEVGSSGDYVHPDLQDLSFGALGHEQGSLPPPIQPSDRHVSSGEAVWDQNRGSLSDFSDYESNEEDHRTSATHQAGSSSSMHSGGRLVDVEDPFADPFAD
ncbi:hypothetical protein HYDPIDRAFT_88841 [Hydnomerulius pinastri MD-312]|uniref:VHS domain-containing protein n=1 Tax=Hydnomerulius pinastri MD-312 TaxID=994086 RepID=A0A0C9WG94_9AGAM|nr:hypothetical protein HYDPIDRAFT_88841 [Hydnomerulius pinastri MD-312]